MLLLYGLNYKTDNFQVSLNARTADNLVRARCLNNLLREKHFGVPQNSGTRVFGVGEMKTYKMLNNSSSNYLYQLRYRNLRISLQSFLQ